MKWRITLLAMALMFCGCNVKHVSNERAEWEYKTVAIENDEHGMEQFYFSQMQTNDDAVNMIESSRKNVGEFDFDNPKNDLDQYGRDGWELVSAIPQTEAMHPAGHGDGSIIASVRTGKITLIFRRQK